MLIQATTLYRLLLQLNRELHHRNLVSLREVILEDKSIYMVFEYAEHDFLVRDTFRLRVMPSLIISSKSSITILKLLELLFHLPHFAAFFTSSSAECTFFTLTSCSTVI